MIIGTRKCNNIGTRKYKNMPTPIYTIITNQVLYKGIYLDMVLIITPLPQETAYHDKKKKRMLNSLIAINKRRIHPDIEQTNIQ